MAEEIKILFGGDFLPGRGTENYVIKNPKKIWGDTIPLFQKADYRIINFEAPVTNSLQRIPKTGPHLRVPKQTLNAVKKADIDLVTLANNHIRDCDSEGVLDTIQNCTTFGVKTIGAGRNLPEAEKVIIEDIKGNSIAFINVAENEWNSATLETAGSNPFDIISITRKIIQYKNSVDFLILIVHGGHEHHQNPNPSIVKSLRYFSDMGADAVICHHTHCYNGYEIYKDTPIFYGLGNLFFPNKTGLKTSHEGFLLELKLMKNEKIYFKLYPYQQFLNPNFPEIQLMSGKDRQDFFSEIEKLNGIISDEEKLLKNWEAYVDSKIHEVLAMFIAPNDFVRKVIGKLKLSKLLTSKKIWRYRLNQIRCESHSYLTKSALHRHLTHKNT